MVSIRNLAVAASAIVGITSAAPTELVRKDGAVAQTNNTQEFYLTVKVTSGPTTFEGYRVESYHTGAGFGDPVFVPAPGGNKLFLNNTQLQFDLNGYPNSLEASIADTNYARWEPVSIGTGYGNGVFADEGAKGIVNTDQEAGGWIICEWFHGYNLPQLFQLIAGFDSEPQNLPSSCSNVLLIPEYI